MLHLYQLTILRNPIPDAKKWVLFLIRRIELFFLARIWGSSNVRMLAWLHWIGTCIIFKSNFCQTWKHFWIIFLMMFILFRWRRQYTHKQCLEYTGCKHKKKQITFLFVQRRSFTLGAHLNIVQLLNASLIERLKGFGSLR